MVRPPLSQEERARGERLGRLLRQWRGSRSMAEVAIASGVPVETLRKIETGRIVTPAFFTVVALAEAVGISLEEVVACCADAGPGESLSALLGAAAGGRGGSVGFSHELRRPDPRLRRRRHD